MIIKFVNTSHNRTFEVGEDGVTQITEHPAKGESGRWYYDIHFHAKGEKMRLFDVDEVFYTKDEVEEWDV